MGLPRGFVGTIRIAAEAVAPPRRGPPGVKRGNTTRSPAIGVARVIAERPRVILTSAELRLLYSRGPFAPSPCPPILETFTCESLLELWSASCWWGQPWQKARGPWRCFGGLRRKAAPSSQCRGAALGAASAKEAKITPAVRPMRNAASTKLGPTLGACSAHNSVAPATAGKSTSPAGP